MIRTGENFAWLFFLTKRHNSRTDISLLFVISLARSTKETSTGMSKIRKRLVIFSQTIRADSDTPIKLKILHASMAHVASVVCIIRLPDLVYRIFAILSMISDGLPMGHVSEEIKSPG